LHAKSVAGRQEEEKKKPVWAYADGLLGKRLSTNDSPKMEANSR
jgi:hypothetical protein